MKRHWTGGISSPRTSVVRGWPACVIGAKAAEIRVDPERCTTDPDQVTCLRCLDWIANDVRVDRPVSAAVKHDVVASAIARGIGLGTGARSRKRRTAGRR